MSTITLIFDEVSETKRVTRRVGSSGGSNCCLESQACEEITETKSPLDCEAGDKMILFLKDPSLILSASGLIIGDIIHRTFLNRQYTYTVQYDDALLAVGTLPNSITQCDILKACCYDCASEYSDATNTVAPPPIQPIEIPEHTTVGGSGFFNDFTPADLTPVGIVVGVPSPTTVINNSSLDRSMSVSLNINYGAWRNDNSGLRDVQYKFSLDGAPFGFIGGAQQGPFGIARKVLETHVLSFNWVLPPGGSMSIAMRIDIETIIASAGGDTADLIGLFYAWNFLGSTI